MKTNPAIALMQIEAALNHLQNTMIDENGKLTWDNEFFRLYEDLLKRLQETQDIAKNIQKREE